MKLFKNQKPVFFLLVVFFFSIFLSGYEYKKESDRKEFIHKYQSSKKYFLKAENSFRKGDYIKTWKELEKCIKIFPLHAKAQYLKALLLYNQKDYPAALESIILAKTNIVKLDQLQDRFKVERKNELKEYQEDLNNGYYVGYFGDNNPCFVDFGEHYSSILSRSVNFMLDSKETAGMAVPADYFYVHGNILFKMKKYEEAVVQYVEVVKRNPRHGQAFNNLANLFLMARQKDKAAYCVNQAEACGFKVDPRFKKLLQ